jgi:hypothetical protein
MRRKDRSCRWEDNITMHLVETAWQKWEELIWLRHGTTLQALVHMVMNPDTGQKVQNFLRC